MRHIGPGWLKMQFSICSSPLLVSTLTSPQPTSGPESVLSAAACQYRLVRGNIS